MGTPLVSVIVVTYNHEKYIGDCLDGILMQQVNFPYEIIIGDDCSTDNTVNIIKQYQRCFPNIKLITPPHNIFSTGDEISHKYLLCEAKGKYVAFCDGDDYWINSFKLQQQVDFMESHKYYSMCFHDHLIKSDNGSLYSHYRLNKDCNVHLSELLNLCVCQTSTTLGLRENLLTQPTDSYYSHPQHTFSDVNYYMSWYVAGKIFHIAGDWSIYRVHNNSIMSQERSPKKMRSKHNSALSAIIDCYGSEYKYIKRNHKSCILLNKSSQLVSQHRYISAIILKVWALILSPKFVYHLYSTK